MNRLRLPSTSSARISTVRRWSFSVKASSIITPTLAASTARPWMTAQVQGRCWPARCENRSFGRNREPMPWLSTVKPMFQTNGTQSW